MLHCSSHSALTNDTMQHCGLHSVLSCGTLFDHTFCHGYLLCILLSPYHMDCATISTMCVCLRLCNCCVCVYYHSHSKNIINCDFFHYQLLLNINIYEF